jgi:predicted membrane protein
MEVKTETITIQADKTYLHEYSSISQNIEYSIKSTNNNFDLMLLTKNEYVNYLEGVPFQYLFSVTNVKESHNKFLNLRKETHCLLILNNRSSKPLVLEIDTTTNIGVYDYLRKKIKINQVYIINFNGVMPLFLLMSLITIVFIIIIIIQCIIRKRREKEEVNVLKSTDYEFNELNQDDFFDELERGASIQNQDDENIQNQDDFFNK